MQSLPNTQISTDVPSPTLTNPDMILPDHSPSAGSSPSILRQHQRLPSLPSIGSPGHGRSGSVPEENSRMKGAMYSPFRNGVLRRHDGTTRLRSTSDRGDDRPDHEKILLSCQQSGEVPFASPPTIRDDTNGFRQRIYTESTQGDYENDEGTYSTPGILEEDESDPYSHAAMTKRAEEILANAKKRLTNMEGNLSRARSTVGVRPSSSMSSFRNRSPEPVSLYTLSGKANKSGTFSPSKHRQDHLAHPDDTKQGHSRVFSETSVPSSLHTGLPNGHSAGRGTESSSSLGINGADANSLDRQSEPSRNWFWNGLTRNTSLNHTNRHANGLQALNEDGPATESFDQRAAREDVIEEERSIDLQSPTAAGFNTQNPPTAGLTRARSTTQMHDLREQMQDLKGKISTLKQRAKEDNLRRRSLQSLRTPSPFTAAEQWYSRTPSPGVIETEAAFEPGEINSQAPNIPEDQDRDAPQDSGHASPEEPFARNDDEKTNNRVLLGNGQLDEVHRDNSVIMDIPENESIGLDVLPSQKERLVLVDDSLASEVRRNHSDTAVNEEASAEEFEAKEDSLYGDQDYHDTSTSPIITKHEDREDAFDYEHYILTSAMGSYSGIGVRRSSSNRKRSSSLSSESSVETTKPRNSVGDDPVQGEAHLMNGRHGRQDSVDSVSTTNTYATANEGQDSDSSQEERIYHQATAVSWQPEPPRKHKPNVSNESAPDRLQSNGLLNHGSKKHIASAQKGYMNGLSRKHPPTTVEKSEFPQPPDLLTVLSATNSWQEGAPPLRLEIGDRDRELLERLVKSLAKVCSQVHSLGGEESPYEGRVLRRKLDAARRVLDGEMNGEAF